MNKIKNNTCKMSDRFVGTGDAGMHNGVMRALLAADHRKRTKKQCSANTIQWLVIL